jgi:hypothetical protein
VRGVLNTPELECVDCGYRRPLKEEHCPLCQSSASAREEVRVLKSKKEPIEIGLARAIGGAMVIGVFGVLWATFEELRAGHWWMLFLCIAILGAMSIIVYRIAIILVEWKRMQEREE